LLFVWGGGGGDDVDIASPKGETEVSLLL
jgi:hypothetical protein